MILKQNELAWNSRQIGLLFFQLSLFIKSCSRLSDSPVLGVDSRQVHRILKLLARCIHTPVCFPFSSCASCLFRSRFRGAWPRGIVWAGCVGDYGRLGQAGTTKGRSYNTALFLAYFDACSVSVLTITYNNILLEAPRHIYEDNPGVTVSCTGPLYTDSIKGLGNIEEDNVQRFLLFLTFFLQLMEGEYHITCLSVWPKLTKTQEAIQEKSGEATR